MRYAISSTADVFHLLTDSQDETLCGLSVLPLIINRPAMSASLYLTEVVETARDLCEKCAAIKAKSSDRQL